MSNKEKLIADFDPNGLGTSGNIFALPFDEETADLTSIGAIGSFNETT